MLSSLSHLNRLFRYHCGWPSLLERWSFLHQKLQMIDYLIFWCNWKKKFSHALLEKRWHRRLTGKEVLMPPSLDRPSLRFWHVVNCFYNVRIRLKSISGYNIAQEIHLISLVVELNCDKILMFCSLSHSITSSRALSCSAVFLPRWQCGHVLLELRAYRWIAEVVVYLSLYHVAGCTNSKRHSVEFVLSAWCLKCAQMRLFFVELFVAITHVDHSERSLFPQFAGYFFGCWQLVVLSLDWIVEISWI